MVWTGYLYRDNDINLVLGGRIATQYGGFNDVDGRPGFVVVDPSEGEALVAVTPAVDSAGLSTPVDYFLDKTNQPEPEVQDDRREVLDQVFPTLAEAKEDRRAQILFPYNITQSHWLTGEILILREWAKGSATYQIRVYAHDPYGGGKMSPGDFAKLEATLEAGIAKFDAGAEYSIANGTSPYTRRQAIGDGTSCGVIVVRDLLLRIDGDSLDPEQPFAVGAKALREEQLQWVKADYPQDDVDVENFEARTSEAPPTGQAAFEDGIIDRQTATSAAALVASIENGELRNRVIRAIRSRPIYGDDYVQGVMIALTEGPTDLASRGVTLSEHDIDSVNRLWTALFDSSADVLHGDAASTIYSMNPQLDVCEEFAIRSDINTPSGRGELNKLLLQILLDVESLRFASRATTGQLDVLVDRSADIDMIWSTYPIRRDNWIGFYNDAAEVADGTRGAFADIQAAIQQARHFILMTDWSFHPQTYLTRTGDGDMTIGQLLVNAADANVLVSILTWNHSKPAPDPANQAAGLWFRDHPPKQRGLYWHASGHTFEHSHHQKFIVLDAPLDPNLPDGPRTLEVFFGGLDITKGRFDWPDHVLCPGGAGDDSDKFVGQYDDYYNAEFGDDQQIVRQPWHDIHAQLIGPAALDFVYEYLGRWARVTWSEATSYPADRSSSTDTYVGVVLNAVNDALGKLTTADLAGKIKAKDGSALELGFNVRLIRSMLKSNWGFNTRETQMYSKLAPHLTWTLAKDYEASIQEAYLEAISLADEFIYIETQYFIGAGKYWNTSVFDIRNTVPLAIADRIIAKAGTDFHVYIVIPMYPEGPPDGALQPIRYFQIETIKFILRRLKDAGIKDWKRYISFYFLAKGTNLGKAPVTRSGRRDNVLGNQRYMIYVHSKFMIVDDRYAILGSANLNERSLAGNRDTEIAALIWPAQKGRSQTLTDFRKRVWIEHLGNESTIKVLGETPGLAQTVKFVQTEATTNLQNFLAGKGNEHLCLLPLALVDRHSVLPRGRDDEIKVLRVPHTDAMEYIPDRARHAYTNKDSWAMKPTTTLKLFDFGE